VSLRLREFHLREDIAVKNLPRRCKVAGGYVALHSTPQFEQLRRREWLRLYCVHAGSPHIVTQAVSRRGAQLTNVSALKATLFVWNNETWDAAPLGESDISSEASRELVKRASSSSAIKTPF